MGSLAGHNMTHHGQATEARRIWKTSATGEELQTYCMDLPTNGGPRIYPIEGCPGRASTRTAMRVHFLHWHVLDTVVILEGGNPPHPRCPHCDMLIPLRTLKRRHPTTSQCARGAKKKRRRLAEAELRESTKRAFEAYGEPLENVTAFKYLRRVLMAGYDDWPEVVGILIKARNSWGRLCRILIREGADPKVSGHFFKAVLQAVLLLQRH